MSSIRTTSLAAALSVLGSISRVSAHGFVSGIVIGGEYFPGFNPGAAPYQNPPPPVIGWPNGASDTGFVAPNAFAGGDIVCHLSSRAGEQHATVAAGSSIDLQWNQWPESHHGPVIDYMARCDGECEQADKMALRFFKIDEAGLVNGSPAPGKWASDDLIANNNTWTVTIPSSIAPGNYVLRHEIIALHSADRPDGAQNYPQCINLEVTGSGTETPAGIPATEFYTPNDPGIFLSIYYPALENYTIPGPALFSGASSGDNTPPPSPSSSSSVSTVMVEPIESISAPTPSEAPMEPSITTSSTYGEASAAVDEQTSTTTTDTTTTLTTTVEPGSTPTDANATPSDVAAVPIPSTESSPETEGSGYGYVDETTPTPEDTPVDIPVDAAPTDSTPEGTPVDTPVDAAPTNEAPTDSTPEETPVDTTDDEDDTAEAPTEEPAPSPVVPSTAPVASDSAETPESGPPAGMSLNEFLDWLRDFLTQYFQADGSRKHPRDLAFA